MSHLATPRTRAEAAEADVLDPLAPFRAQFVISPGRLSTWTAIHWAVNPGLRRELYMTSSRSGAETWWVAGSAG